MKVEEKEKSKGMSRREKKGRYKGRERREKNGDRDCVGLGWLVVCMSVMVSSLVSTTVSYEPCLVGPTLQKTHTHTHAMSAFNILVSSTILFLYERNIGRWGPTLLLYSCSKSNSLFSVFVFFC